MVITKGCGEYAEDPLEESASLTLYHFGSAASRNDGGGSLQTFDYQICI